MDYKYKPMIYMKLDYHSGSVCKSTYFHLRNIDSICLILANDACAQLIHSLVSVRVDYCNFILYSLPDNSLYHLQKIQNTAASIWHVYLVFLIFQLHCLTCTSYQLREEVCLLVEIVGDLLEIRQM